MLLEPSTYSEKINPLTYASTDALEGGLVSLVAALFLLASVPRCLDGIDLVEGALWLGFVLHVVEDEEFGFGCEEGGVGNAGRGQVGLGALGHATRVAVVWLAGAGVDDGEVEREGLLQTERVKEAGRHIRDQLHVRVGDGGEAADRGSVEELTVEEEVCIDGAGRHVEVLLDAGKVGEADVNELDVFFGNVCHYFFWTLEHSQGLLWCLRYDSGLSWKG